MTKNMTDNIPYKNEILRKIIHLFILVLPIGFYFLGRKDFLVILLPITTIFVVMDYFRRENEAIRILFEKLFGIILRQHELDGQKLCGASWMLLSASIVFATCKVEIAVIAFSILAISDAAASLVGRSFISKPFFEKSFAGSVAFGFTGLIILFVCGGIFEANLWFYLFAIFSLFATTLIEARPSLFGIDDNFMVPISFSFAMTLFDWMWDLTTSSYIF